MQARQARFPNQICEGLPPCLIAGRTAAIEAGIRRAAEILAEARYPLVYSPGNMASEAQRVAVGIADWTCATVYRMEQVPIPYRPAFDSPLPIAPEILKAIEPRVRPG